jgi:isopentenyldiphosphate isomerase
MSFDAADELVDVIDAEGNTIGVVTRREMRRQRLPHRCVYLLVFNSRGELFIHQRTATKDVYPSYWDLAVGGVLAAAETFDNAARREALEEIGVQVVPQQVFPFRYEDERTVAQGVVFRTSHDGPFRLQREEVVRGDFVTLSELPLRIARDLFCPDGLEVWREYMKRVHIQL